MFELEVLHIDFVFCFLLSVLSFEVYVLVNDSQAHLVRLPEKKIIIIG